MKVGILGLGLIGGSLARAYAIAGHTVYDSVRNESMLSFAQLAGAVHAPLTQNNIGQCDLILLAIYPDGCASWLEENAPSISPDTLVIDCCGIKREICRRSFPLAERYGFTFVGGHPMAGSQFSGFKYSRADLFENAPMVLVPPRFDDMELLDDVIVEIRQAIEMTGIYRDDIKGTRELFSSILDNRLNNAMKYLTSITLLVALPTLISGLYGMNVNAAGMPFAGTPYGFAIVCGFTLAVCAVAAWILHKKHML